MVDCTVFTNYEVIDLYISYVFHKEELANTLHPSRKHITVAVHETVLGEGEVRV